MGTIYVVVHDIDTVHGTASRAEFADRTEAERFLADQPRATRDRKAHAYLVMIEEKP